MTVNLLSHYTIAPGLLPPLAAKMPDLRMIIEESRRRVRKTEDEGKDSALDSRTSFACNMLELA